MGLAPYTHVTYGGHTVNARTAAMLDAAADRLGYDLSVTQGSYNAGGVSASAGTHDGGGAVDLVAYDWQHKVHALRAVGFAAWHRTAIPGLWGEHIHCIAIGDQQLSSGARNQVSAYYNHRDGLAGNNYDGFWRPSPIPVFDYGDREHNKVRKSRWSHGHVFVGRLHEGAEKNDSVRRLQYVLSKRGDVDVANIVIDGDYGEQTRRAVRQFQRASADHGGNDGKEVSWGQAVRLFGQKKFTLHEDLH